MDVEGLNDEWSPPPADDALLRRLAQMFHEEDAPPAGALELAKATFGLRALDAELAALTADSYTDSAALALRASGSTDGPRLLTFEAADFAVELEAHRVGPRRRLLGQLIPAAPARIEVRQTGTPDTPSVHADDQGRFVIENVQPGSLSLICRQPGQRPIATEWTALD
ncbi:MAG TPA: carboxypeptidase-like regulatory domain-containing protein [Micromonosporaceae bacterium]|nr:carboxypeptidase-like regulatory domain-containing protein [Micromonosporaceae bacterium]